MQKKQFNKLTKKITRMVGLKCEALVSYDKLNDIPELKLECVHARAVRRAAHANVILV
jgi:hypothetical protein